jgi:sugar phosphate isomerase/epimerase
MKLGVLTHYSDKILRWVAQTGFEAVELSAWPEGPMDATTFTADRQRKLTGLTAELGLEISSLGYYPSHLDADPNERVRIADYFQALLRLAADLGVPVVSTHAAGSPLSTLEEKLTQFAEVFTPHLELAERLGVKVALENCPHGPGGGNFINGPESWDAAFEAIDSDFLGIEMDPSHLVFRFIDYGRAIRDYGSRIFHVHAKDTMIRWDVLGRVGIYGSGWWCFRIPGLGEVNWARFIDALRLAGYDGAVVIENEDPYFGTGGRDIIYQDPADLPHASRQAFLYGYRHLRPLIAH